MEIHLNILSYLRGPLYDSLQANIYLYGIILLEGKNDGFVGTTCPKCLKTILVNVERKVFDNAVFWLNGQDSNGRSHYFEPLGYFSPYSDLGLSEVGEQVEVEIDDRVDLKLVDPSKPPLKLTPTVNNSGETGINGVELRCQLGDYEIEEKLDSDIYYRTYVDGLADVFGTYYNIWWLTKNAVVTALKCELESEVRCFPRYIHQFSLLEKVDQFSWKYYLSENLYSTSQKSAQNSIDTLQDSGIEPKSLDKPPASPKIIGYFKHLNLKQLDDDSWLHASFQDILMDKSSFLDESIKNPRAIERFLKCRRDEIYPGNLTVSKLQWGLAKIKDFCNYSAKIANEQSFFT